MRVLGASFYGRFVVAALIPMLLQAQQQTAATDAGTPIFRTGTNLVTIDVTVRDKTGKVIEGLKATDFAIFEDGKQQKLSVFDFQKLSVEPAPPPALSLA